jgi:hypothetical protein
MNPPPPVANAAANQLLDNAYAYAGPMPNNAEVRVGRSVKRAKVALELHNATDGHVYVTTAEVGQQVMHTTSGAVAASMNVAGAPGILAAIQALTNTVNNNHANLTNTVNNLTNNHANLTNTVNNLTNTVNNLTNTVNNIAARQTNSVASERDDLLQPLTNAAGRYQPTSPTHIWSLSA